MRLYFVRHGQSKLNALNVHQDASVELSELGVRQAHLVARRLASREIDAIVSSTYARATQTAQIIGAALHKPVAVTPLLAEMKRPTAVEGKHHDDPDAVEIKDRILANFHDHTWRYADEETFLDLRERAQRCIDYIVGRGRDSLLAVTHGGIMTMIVAVLLYGDDLEPQDVLRLRSFVRTTNTGITVCERAADGTWTLLTWNDHAHLECLEDASQAVPHGDAEE